MSGPGPFARRDARKVMVAVIDGNAEHRHQIVCALSPYYHVVDYAEGAHALDELSRCPPHVMIIDEVVPPSGALVLLAQFRDDRRFSKVPAICTTRDSSERGRGGFDAMLEKPFRRSLLLSCVSSQVNRRVEADWDSLASEQHAALRQTLDTFNGISDLIERGEPLQYRELREACSPLISAVANNDYRSILKGVRDHDDYSYVHSLRVATLLSVFGYTIGLKGDDLLQLAAGGLMHDIGKMHIPHDVLNKPGRLNPDEWEMMKGHVGITVDYLRDHSDMPRGAVIIAAQHHERVDGEGYPRGLKGGQLNELARMASIVDIFGALTDRRAYKPSLSPEQALQVMSGPMKPGLDQVLLRLFRDMLLDVTRDSSDTRMGMAMPALV